MKKIIIFAAGCALALCRCATAPRAAHEGTAAAAPSGTLDSIVNTAVTDLQTHTALAQLNGHVAINISSGSKELDGQFAGALHSAFPNFASDAESVNREDLYQMTVKVYRENDDAAVLVRVFDFEDKPVVERTITVPLIAEDVLETLQYKTAVIAKNEFDAYLDAAFGSAGAVAAEARPLWDYIERGLAFIEEEEYERALAEFRAALELRPDYAPALYFSGDVYYYQDEYDEAIAYYTQTLNIDPAPAADLYYEDAYFMRGLCYLEQEEYDQAIADFDQSEKLRPNNAQVFFRRGFARYFNKEYDQAVQDYSQSIKLKPDYAETYYWRALAYAEKDRARNAIADCEKALKIKPDYTDARELLARLRPPPKPLVVPSWLKPDIEFEMRWNNYPLCLGLGLAPQAFVLDVPFIVFNYYLLAQIGYPFSEKNSISGRFVAGYLLRYNEHFYIPADIGFSFGENEGEESGGFTFSAGVMKIWKFWEAFGVYTTVKINIGTDVKNCLNNTLVISTGVVHSLLKRR